MEDNELIPIMVEKGEIIVNDAFYVRKGEGVCAIGIDLASKYAECDIISEDIDTCPVIYLSSSERTLSINKSLEGTPTRLILKTFQHWDVWAIDISKYTVKICLIKQS